MVPVDDPYYGQVGKACIVLKAGALPPAVEELRAFCRDKLARYKIPHFFAFVDRLPRNALGKVLKRELIAQHRTQGDEEKHV